MLHDYTLLGLDCTQPGWTPMLQAPGLAGNFCPMFLKTSVASAANGVTPMVPPTIAISTSQSGAADILAAIALPAALVTPGFHHTQVLGICRHSIGGPIYVKVATPAVASVYTVDLHLIGITS